MRNGSRAFRSGSMHGREVGTFVCSAGKERVLHQTTSYSAIIASDSLLDVDGREREARAMQTVHLFGTGEVAGMEIGGRCRDCTLRFWQRCILPRKGSA